MQQSSAATLAPSTAHKKPTLRLESDAEDDDGDGDDEVPESRSRNFSDNSGPKIEGAALLI